MAKLKANQFEYRPGLVITERQIPFQTDMVQAILEGRKTQTRRDRNLDLINQNPDEWELCWVGNTVVNNRLPEIFGVMFQHRVFRNKEIFIKSPYGKPGDLLWVRETTCQVMREHAHELLEGARNQSLIIYKTDFHPDWMVYAKEKYGYKWKPSIYMPKDAARIWLMVEEVRVERVQDISEEDAIDEGIESIDQHGQIVWKRYDGYYSVTSQAYVSFWSLWASINGEESWDSNPWVWVVKFRVLSKTGRPSREEILSAYYDVTSECNANEETASADSRDRSDASDKRKEVGNG